MIDCYKILGVSKNATASEIKKAYRKKAKEFHPDATHTASSTQFHQLVKAYEILSNSRQRSIFDENEFYYSNVSRSKNYKEFDYHEWLSERTDYESRAKLIFFDLMHNREDEAVSEFKKMNMNHADFSLKHWFSREDFMDFGYILAEELAFRNEFYDAIILLEQIIQMEYSYNYFRLFFPEVVDFTLGILKYSIEGNVNDELAIDVWERALDLNFGEKEDAIFLQKMSTAYKRLGDERTAKICLEEAVKLKKN